jgi:bzd-type benzoyl-CoA reductase N subunit
MVEATLERFREAFKNRYALGKKIKASGQRVIGWLCAWVPEEIFHAAGFLPMRILGGSGETAQGDAYLYSNNCTFVRSCLEEAFRGNYDFLDGIIGCNSCDHVRRLYDSWHQYIATPYKMALGVPCKVTPTTINLFANDFAFLQKELEETFGVTITNEALRRSIGVYNHSRSLLKQLYDLRRSDSPPITGAETMEVLRASWSLPREEYNDLLKELLQALPGREVTDGDTFRLMILGSELDDPEYFRAIEDQGGIVVIDDLCCGSRNFWNQVELEGDKDPIRALAQRYLERPFCARMHPSSVRVAHLQQLARDYRIDGVIFESIKFCDSHAGTFPVIKMCFDEIDLPVLNLEREYVMTGAGQMKTRVGAFFESLEGRRV